MREGRVSYDSSSRSEDPSSCDQILPRGVRPKGPARREAPPKEPSRVRWLTRQEAARLLRSAKAPHLRRFLLIGLYTGMRSQAILGLSWMPSTSSGWVDLQSEVLYRRGETVRRTK